jgi:hypothetical protein
VDDESHTSLLTGLHLKTILLSRIVAPSLADELEIESATRFAGTTVKHGKRLPISGAACPFVALKKCSS